MSAFAAPDWEINHFADNACKELFKTKKKVWKKQKSKQRKSKEESLKQKVKKVIVRKHLNDQELVTISKSNVQQKSAKSKVKISNDPAPETRGRENRKNRNKKENRLKKLDNRKLSVTKETSAHQMKVEAKSTHKTKVQKPSVMRETKMKSSPYMQKTSVTKGNKNNPLTLRAKMLQRVKSAHFRYLNEQMYTNEVKDAEKYFKNDPQAFTAYHEGFQQQVSQWPVNPLDIIIGSIKKLPADRVIADFGCGEGTLSKSVPHQVHSFDLMAVNEEIIACDMSHVPLGNNAVDVVVFCLSLMGTNLKEYLKEANRVLKTGGLLKIAEVESRFEDLNQFFKNLRPYGFVNISKDSSHNLFYFLDFKKEAGLKNKLPNIALKPCLYKKR